MGAGYVAACVFIAILIVLGLYLYENHNREARGCKMTTKNGIGMPMTWKCPVNSGK